MPTFYEDLRDSIQADANGLGFLDATGHRKPDDQILQLANGPNPQFTVDISIPLEDVIRFVVKNKLYSTLKRARSNAQLTAQQQVAADSLFDFLSIRVTYVDINTISDAIDLLTPAVFPQNVRDQFMMMGKRQISWAEWRYGRKLSMDDIMRSH
jgi:hypothetical protein